MQTEGWGLEPAPSDYLCGPRMEDSDAFDARGRSYPGRQCLLSLFTGHADVYDILLTTQGKKKKEEMKDSTEIFAVYFSSGCFKRKLEKSL